MIREYALDPRAMSNWKDFIRLYDGFGVHHGRLISRFPKKWKRLVYEACTHCGDVEKKKIEVRLDEIEQKMLVSPRTYNGNLPWLSNAESSHEQAPFAAIVAVENPRSHNRVLLVDELEEANPSWHVEREKCIPKTAMEMTQCVGALLEISEEILFVDQHFDPQNPRYTDPLFLFIARACRNGQAPKRLEYHLRMFEPTSDRFRSKEVFESQCRKLARKCPPNLQILFIRWKNMDAGERMHPRYILTERGGFRIDYGLDEGAPGVSTDISILDPMVHLQRWRDFQKETAAFELVDEILVG